jgi:amino acid adenylation domain-containing protein
MGSLQSVDFWRARAPRRYDLLRPGTAPLPSREATRMLQDAVTRAARLRPASRAVVGEDATMTYAEIDEYSNRLAHVLRAHGCHRGDRVGVLMPRSARAVASFIGVLKAGCVYVPLDPAGRLVRAAEILRKSEPHVVLAGGCGREILEDLDSRRALRRAIVGWLDPSAPPRSARFTLEDVSHGSPDPLAIDSHPDDLAYMMFTSGVREPLRGVPTTHRNLGVFVDWALDHFKLGPDDRVAGHTSLTLASSSFDVHATFAAGAELHQLPVAASSDSRAAIDFIENRSVSVWLSAPATLMRAARSDLLEGRDVSSLRHVAWCGDALPTRALHYWRQHAPGATLTNMYGSTETTIACSYYSVPDDFEVTRAHVPIGAACPGHELLVLDDELNEVPEGEVGDIYVRGAGLSPGYWRDPEATRAAFPTRLSSQCSERLFRTGDRGRRGPNGTVRLLGRPDFQLEASGEGVGPDEVEHAILHLQEVAACAVVPVTVSEVGGSLVGCAYVPSNGRALSIREVRRQLAERLPEHIIPSRWLILDELPVDGRGKVDRALIRTLLRGWPSSHQVEAGDRPHISMWR